MTASAFRSNRRPCWRPARRDLAVSAPRSSSSISLGSSRSSKATACGISAAFSIMLASGFATHRPSLIVTSGPHAGRIRGAQTRLSDSPFANAVGSMSSVNSNRRSACAAKACTSTRGLNVTYVTGQSSPAAVASRPRERPDSRPVTWPSPGGDGYRRGPAASTFL